MAEALGVASSVLAVLGVAYKSTQTLHSLLKSFNSHVDRVLSLLEELSVLLEVLSKLSDLLESDHHLDLSALETPVSRCNKACTDFTAILLSCSSRTKGNRTSFRDWFKLRYMGDDIDGFKRQISSYRQIIGVAIAEANIRKSCATEDSINNLAEQLATTQANLEQRLICITDKLDDFGRSLDTDMDDMEISAIREERQSTEECLQICADLIEHMDSLEPLQNESPRIEGPVKTPERSPARLTTSGLLECQEILRRTVKKLEAHHKSLLEESFDKFKARATTSSQLEELGSLQEELAAITESREICSTIKNSGTGDLFQIMASTDGTIIHGTNEGHGHVLQGGGHFDKDSFKTMMEVFQSRSGATNNLQVEIKPDKSSSVYFGMQHAQGLGTNFIGSGNQQKTWH